MMNKNTLEIKSAQILPKIYFDSAQKKWFFLAKKLSKNLPEFCQKSTKILSKIYFDSEQKSAKFPPKFSQV